jgi:TctA family transporter
MEEYMRRALLLSCDPMVFIERPISAALLGFRAFAIIPASPRAMYKKRDGALRE